MMPLNKIFETVAQIALKHHQNRSPWNQKFDFSGLQNGKIRIIIREIDADTVSLSRQELQLKTFEAQSINIFTHRPVVASSSFYEASPETILAPRIDKKTALDVIDDHVTDINLVSGRYESWLSRMRAQEQKTAPAAPSP